MRWEDSRKYITYTCPNGRKCRCAKLHGEKFSKEMMEYEFEIRRECLDGTEQIRPESGRGNHAHGGGGQPKLDGSDQLAEKILRGAGGTAEVAGRADDQTRFGKSGESTDQNPTRNAEKFGAASGKNDSDVAIIHAGITVTGWETERGILLAAERIRRMEAQNTIENAQSDCDFTDGAALVIAGIADVATIMDEPSEDEDIERHSDSKVLAEEIRRKEALGMRME